MNFFTPELYQRFNSFDEMEAGRADEDWDLAETAYKERLASLRELMPSQVAELSELNLHDALVVSRGERTQPSGEFPFLWSVVAIVSVTVGEEVVSLIYWLRDHVVEREAPEGWRFSKLQEQWLYDEVDIVDERRGSFVHRILLSSGITLEIPFISVIIHRFVVPTAMKLAKRSA